MTTEIRVPTLGESVTEATVSQWFKKKGEAVTADEPLVELETDKVTIEVRGRKHEIDISTLSDEDQEFIKNWNP